MTSLTDRCCRQASKKIRTTFDDDDDLDLPPQRAFTSRAEKRKAIEVISELLQLNESPVSSRKKPLSQYSDEDFAREQRELAINKARIEIRNMELKTELYDRLMNAADRLEPFLAKTSQLVDMLITERSNRTLVPVEVLAMSHSASDNPDQTHAVIHKM